MLLQYISVQCSYGVKASCVESPPPSRLGGLRRCLGGLKRLGGPKQGSALSPRRRHKNIGAVMAECKPDSTPMDSCPKV